MQVLGRYHQEQTRSSPINTLDNALIELDAGRKKIVASMQNPYLEWVAWVSFEAELQKHLEYAADAPPEIQHWRALGQKICQFHLALARRSPQALILQTEIDRALPSAMRNDRGADWSAFPLRLEPTEETGEDDAVR